MNEPDAPPLAEPDRVERYVVEAAAREGLAIMTERLAAAEERVAAARERQLVAMTRIAALEAAHPIAADDVTRELPERRPAARATTVRVTKSIAAGG